MARVRRRSGESCTPCASAVLIDGAIHHSRGIGIGTPRSFFFGKDRTVALRIIVTRTEPDLFSVAHNGQTPYGGVSDTSCCQSILIHVSPM